MYKRRFLILHILSKISKKNLLLCTECKDQKAENLINNHVPKLEFEKILLKSKSKHVQDI